MSGLALFGLVVFIIYVFVCGIAIGVLSQKRIDYDG